MKAAVATAAVLAAASAGPTPAQISRAVARATHSRSLWATVNVCQRRGSLVGIRGQMPALGFAARLAMTIRVRYWNAQDRRFEPVPGGVRRLALGSFTHGTVQDGVEFSFRPPVRLTGSITFEWRRGRRLIGTATRATVGGVKGVDESEPPGYSAATCRLR